MIAPSVHILTPNSMLLKWPTAILEKAGGPIKTYMDAIAAEFPSEITEMVPSYTELAIYLKSQECLKTVSNKLKAWSSSEMQQFTSAREMRTVNIPVCYDKKFGLDLDSVAAFHGISSEQLIDIHASANYKVQFLGFLPGFPYLTGLPKELCTPRRETPRPRITKGSVGIGGTQTGVYPQDSPGGWNIIGKTPLLFFDVNAVLPALLRTGDKVVFEPISVTEFERIAKQVEKRTFSPKIVLHD